MNGLMLHCGGHALDRAALANTAIPRALGSRHCIRPFIDDVELITEELNGVGLKVVDESFGIVGPDDDPKRFFGVMEVEPLEGEFIGKNDGYGLMIGLRGSYDQTLPRGMAVGSRVFVCDNLAFSGEIKMSTRQTTFINRRIPEMIHRAIDQVPLLAEHQHKRFDAYRNTEIPQRVGDAALIELVRRDAIAPSHLGRAVAEWDEPSHEEHAEQGRSLWRLHNAVTEAIKPANAERPAVLPAMRRTRLLTGYLDEMAGIDDWQEAA